MGQRGRSVFPASRSFRDTPQRGAGPGTRWRAHPLGTVAVVAPPGADRRGDPGAPAPAAPHPPGRTGARRRAHGRRQRSGAGRGGGARAAPPVTLGLGDGPGPATADPSDPGAGRVDPAGGRLAYRPEPRNLLRRARPCRYGGRGPPCRRSDVSAGGAGHGPAPEARAAFPPGAPGPKAAEASGAAGSGSRAEAGQTPTTGEGGTRRRG